MSSRLAYGISILLFWGLTAQAAPVSRLCSDVSRQAAPVTLEEDVRAYYQQIDRADVDAALSRFARDARYERGSQVLNGLESIREFYRKLRTLQGAHSLTSVKTKGNRVSVEGAFEGTSNRVPVKILFTDAWEYDLVTGEVVHRVSVLTNEQGVPLSL